MPTEETLRQILALAIYAPSGDNSQPWEFEIGQATISIFNLPDRDTTLYNFHQHGSYLGHGALIENIIIISSHLGYKALVQAFPGEENCTARISFSSIQPRPERLYSAITKRATNRKPYEMKSLTPEHRSMLFEAVASFRETPLVLIEDREKIVEVAKAVSLNERLLMENRPLHDFLFELIRWNKEEESQKPGLLIETMELPPPVRFLFRHVLWRWNAVRSLNMIGFSRMLPKQTASLYQACSAVGAIMIDTSDDVAFLNAGRALQRFWLTATHLGISLQPITALPYLQRRIHAGEAVAFSPEHIRLILEKHSKITQAFSLTSDDHIAILFRIGYSGAPSAYSIKLPPVMRHSK